MEKRSVVVSQAGGFVGSTEIASGDVGESVTVSFPEMVFQPISYNSFRVGGFSATTTIREGESRTGAIARVMLDLEAAAREDFKRKLALFRRCYEEMTGEGE